MPASPDRCVVLVPVAHHIEPPCERALHELERRGYAVWRVWGHSDLPRGRSQMATDALAAGFDELFWIDADIEFHPDSVDLVRAHDLPMVGGIYPVKGQQRVTVVPLSRDASFQMGDGGGLAAVRYAGTGFLHTRRSVYDAVQAIDALPTCGGEDEPPLVPYFLPALIEEDGRWKYLSEDYSFCARARRAGVAVQVDTRIRLWHIGTYRYSWEDATATLPRHGSFKIDVRTPRR